MMVFSLGPGRRLIHTHFGQLEAEWAGCRETESISSLRAGRVGCDSARAGSRSWDMGRRGWLCGEGHLTTSVLDGRTLQPVMTLREGTGVHIS